MSKSRSWPIVAPSTPRRRLRPDSNAGRAKTTWRSCVMTVAGILVCVALPGCRASHREAASNAVAQTGSTTTSISAAPNIMQFSVQGFNSVKEVKFPWGWIRWMMNTELDPAASQTFGIVQIDAGKRNQLHKHPNCEELLYVLSGSFESVVGGRRVVMHAGDMIRIPANVPHQGINNTNEPMRAVISYSSGVRQTVTLDSTTE